MAHQEELEVEAVQVLHKRLKFRTLQGAIFPGYLDVYECETPYVLICKVTTEHEHSVRMDVHKEDLASELRLWLEGKVVRNPAAFPPKRVEEAVQRFVKFGKPPLQEDLIMWILSRSELQWAPEPLFCFGGMRALDLSLTTPDDEGEAVDVSKLRENPFAKTADAAVKDGGYMGGDQYRIQGAYGSEEGLALGLPSRQQLLDEPDLGHSSSSSSALRSKQQFASSSIHFKKSANLRCSAAEAEPNPHDLTRQLIGASAALAQLKVQNVKGRQGAKEVLAVTNFTPYHWKLASEIESARKEVDEAMDLRRREIEIARTRKKTAADKFGAIRKKLDEEKTGGNWFKVAEQELLNLRKIKADVADDVQRQRNKAQREAQKVRWTVAPSGFVNRRGKSQRGVTLGPGPIPSSAMHASADPVVQRTLTRYYWDVAGRRHVRKADADENASGSGSVVDKAMDAIRKAASLHRTAELDLRSVFSDFDRSGNGQLSIEEMQAAFLALGVNLDQQALVALFNHFDPNGSGEVSSGEFVWAFFNRRGLVRQWRRKSDRLSDDQIRQKFHAADISGDGKLSPKEFAKFLKSFGVEVTAAERQALMDRFDVDGDGTLDLGEFQDFIVSEMMALNAESNNMLHLRQRSLSPPSRSPSPPAASSFSVTGQRARPHSAHGVPSLPLNVPSGGADARARPASSSSSARGPSRSLIEEREAELDAGFVADALKAQHRVESKLGRSYY
jgi:Ca2+-binding EF-hand superfamily protein